jgi:broad specificity phosphatase PhoE
MYKFIVIRHGATPDEKTAMGGWSEEGLGKEGIEQAHEAAKKVPKGLDGIVTSDLNRAVETAEIISKETHIPILAKSASLRSWNIGNWSGKDPKDIEPKLDKIANDEPDRSASNGESFNAYKKRFLTGLRDILERYKDKEIGILTHSHGTRMIRAWEKEGCPKDLKIDMKSFNAHGMENGGVEKQTVSLPHKK